MKNFVIGLVLGAALASAGFLIFGRQVKDTVGGATESVGSHVEKAGEKIEEAGKKLGN